VKVFEYICFQYLNKTISNRYWSIISYIIATTFTFVNIGQFQILNISKPAGPDNLSPKILKAVFQSLVKPLTILFQKSLNFGVVPGDWKLANVSYIYKGKGGSDQ
jgi:hypothetical protein